MTEIELAEYHGGIHVIREQLWHGHLTIRGMQHAHKILARDRATCPAEIRDECDWLLTQLDAELMMRELDHGVTA